MEISDIISQHILSIENKKCELLLGRIKERIGFKFSNIHNVPKDNIQVVQKQEENANWIHIFWIHENKPMEHLISFCEENFLKGIENNFQTEIKYS